MSPARKPDASHRLAPYTTRLKVFLYGPGEPIYGSTAYQAVTVQNRRGGISVHLRPGTPPGTVCHESVHAALFVLQVHGVDEHEGVGEALAYLAGHIFELIRKDQAAGRAAARTARRATVRV